MQKFTFVDLSETQTEYGKVITGSSNFSIVV